VFSFQSDFRRLEIEYKTPDFLTNIFMLDSSTNYEQKSLKLTKEVFS